MDEPKRTGSPKISRRSMLQGAVAGAAVAAGIAEFRNAVPARAHNLQPMEFQEAYEAAISRPALHYQVYEFPNILNETIWSNIRNGLNGSQFSYGEPAGSLQVAVQ